MLTEDTIGAYFIFIGFFALLIQVILLNSTDWSTIRSFSERINYLAWGVYSKNQIKKHTYTNRQKFILQLRNIFLFLIFSVVFMIILNWML